MARFASMVVMLAVICGCSTAPRVDQITYRGWSGAWRISNPACELVIVPQISRVMHFSLKGERNLLWINPELAGKVLPESHKDWNNYGGEKVWPTQQSLFPQLAGRKWPPPWPWDGGASQLEKIAGGIRMALPEDPKFGARLIREFVMDPHEPRVRVRQYIQKRTGQPMPMTIWTVCQVDDPAMALLPLRWTESASGPNRFRLLADASPLIQEHRAAVTLGRDQDKGLKIGVTPENHFHRGWAGATFADGTTLVISHAIDSGATYPDEGCDAELYTSPVKTARYTELEILSPLVELPAGHVLWDDQSWVIRKLNPEQVKNADAVELLLDTMVTQSDSVLRYNAAEREVGMAQGSTPQR